MSSIDPKVFRCDFCSGTPVAWEYPANDLFSGHKLDISSGGWTACEACYECIETDDRFGLTKRATKGYSENIEPDLKGPRKDAIRKQIRRLHDKFFAHRTGPPKRTKGIEEHVT